MTTYFPFTPNQFYAPTFQPTLDGETYFCTVKWNLFGQRYYLSCTDQQGNLIFNVAIVETAEALQLAALTWDAATLQATAETIAPHGLQIGTVARITIAGDVPTGYDGEWNVSIINDYVFTYSISNDPGVTTVIGNASFVVSLSRGYFNSTIIYRNGQFEVSP